MTSMLENDVKVPTSLNLPLGLRVRLDAAVGPRRRSWATVAALTEWLDREEQRDDHEAAA